MKKPIFSLIVFIVGIGLGIIAAKSKVFSPNLDSEERESDFSSANPKMGDYPQNSNDGKSSRTRSTIGSRNFASLLKLSQNQGSNQDSIAFLEAIESLDLHEITEMLDDIKALRPRDMSTYLLHSTIFKRWANLDPDGAWEAAMKIEDKQMRQNLFSMVIDVISQTNTVKARALLSQIKNPEEKYAATYSLIHNIAKENPYEAFKILQSEPKVKNGFGLYSQLFVEWAKSDLDAAMANLGSIKDAQDRQQALQGILSELISTDSERALSMLDQLPAGVKRSDMIGNIANLWIQRDSEKAIEWIKRLPAADQAKALQTSIWNLREEDPKKVSELLSGLPMNQQNSHLYSQFASSWALKDLEAAQAWVNRLPNNQIKKQAMSGIFSQLSQSDPAKAATLLGESAIDDDNSYAVGSLIGNWIKSDKPAALAWLESLDLRGRAQQNVYSQFIENWAKDDANSAGKYVLAMKDPKLKEQAIESFVQSIGGEDPNLAHDWIMKSLQGDLKNRSLSTYIQNLSYQDHEEALRIFQLSTKNLSAEEIQKNFEDSLTQIASSWARNDPKSASQWVLSLPSGPARANSLTSLVRQYANHDIKGAAEFVNTLSSGKERDQAVGTLVFELQDQDDPESAFDWAASISDTSQRENMIRRAVNTWKTYDRSAAKAAVIRTNLRKEVKDQILKNLEK